MKTTELFQVEGYGVIVTGGASGLGLGYAEALAENGAKVTLLDVDAVRLDEEARRLQNMGYTVREEVLRGPHEHRTDPTERWRAVGVSGVDRAADGSPTWIPPP